MTAKRVFLLLLTAGVVWYAIVNPGGPARQPPPPAPSLQTIASLDLDDPTTYPTFITDVRNKVADETRQCTIQKISKTPAQRYAYVDLIFAGTNKKVALAIDKADLYVLGYSDKMNNNDRFFYFDEVKDTIANKFFPNATGANRIRLKFNGSYTDLERRAGKRKGTLLGMFTLKNSILGIYGRAANEKNQAKFFLVTIQIVSEAARFEYISDEIPPDNHGGVTVDDYMIALENGWAKLSKAVYNSTPSKTTDTKCELANSPVTLKPWTFKTVEDIKKVVGLLKSS